jgi:hypothetical protein
VCSNVKNGKPSSSKQAHKREEVDVNGKGKSEGEGIEIEEKQHNQPSTCQSPPISVRHPVIIAMLFPLPPYPVALFARG